MTSSAPIASVLLLADLLPLAGRLPAGLLEASGLAAADSEIARTGRVVVFQGDVGEALPLQRRLRAAGLRTSLNRLG